MSKKKVDNRPAKMFRYWDFYHKAIWAENPEHYRRQLQLPPSSQPVRVATLAPAPVGYVKTGRGLAYDPIVRVKS